MNWRQSSKFMAATGRPRHLPEFRHDSPGQEPNWWSATLHRIDTDRWGPVVVTIAVDLTDQVRASAFSRERERQHLALQQTIAAVPGHNLVSALQQVVDALVPALPGRRSQYSDCSTRMPSSTSPPPPACPAETRRLALDPITIRRLETMLDAGRHLLPRSLGLHWSRCAGSRPRVTGSGSRRSVRAASGVRPRTTSRSSTPQRSSATLWRRSSRARRSFEAVLRGGPRKRGRRRGRANPQYRPPPTSLRSSASTPKDSEQTRSPNYSYSPRTQSGHTSGTLAATLASAPEPRHSTFSRLPTPIPSYDRRKTRARPRARRRRSPLCCEAR